MLYWAIVFFVVAVIAVALGFGGVAGASAGLAQIVAAILVLFIVLSLIAGLARRT